MTSLANYSGEDWCDEDCQDGEEALIDIKPGFLSAKGKSPQVQVAEMVTSISRREVREEAEAEASREDEVCSRARSMACEVREEARPEEDREHEVRSPKGLDGLQGA